MPANLTAEAKGKWVKASQAKEPKEKLRLLQEFLSSIPKHKGNERLRQQIKRKMAVLKVDLEKHRSKKAHIYTFSIERTGAGLALILGMPNSGKSALLSSLTRAKPKTSEVPFTTQEPVLGKLQYEDVQFQVMELPSLPLGLSMPYSNDVIRGCDIIVLVLDSTQNISDQLNHIIRLLEEKEVNIFPKRSSVEITRTEAGGLRLILNGELVECAMNDVKRLLMEYGYKNAIARVYGMAKLEDVEDAIIEASSIYKPAIILINKIDLEDSDSMKLKEIPLIKIPCIQVSALKRINLESIGEIIFQSLGIVRIYTKEPGEQIHSEEPFIFKDQTTVMDLAKRIHTRFVRDFKYARVWGKSCKYPGERVGLERILVDGDVVEIRTK